MDGRRALVIDDEVHFRYFLRVLLEKAGFAVKMARNGIEALEVLRSWRLETHSRGHAVRRADLRPGTCVRHDRPDAGPASRPRGLP